MSLWFLMTPFALPPSLQAGKNIERAADDAKDAAGDAYDNVKEKAR
jgi:hypothetical protein